MTIVGRKMNIPTRSEPFFRNDVSSAVQLARNAKPYYTLGLKNMETGIIMKQTKLKDFAFLF